VAHTCNPSYLGGRDQEDQGSKPVWANSSQDPILKKPNRKKKGGGGKGGESQGIDPEFKTSITKKNNNNNGPHPVLPIRVTALARHR
jgi:hypothetical protein